METYSCYEHINQDNLKRILRSGKITDPEQVKILESLRRHTKKSGKHQVFFAVKNKSSRKSIGVGRLYPKNNHPSLQGIKSNIRKALAYDRYTDIDIKNAHPTLISQVLRKEQIPCEPLERYVLKRDEFLEVANKQTWTAILNNAQPKTEDPKVVWDYYEAVSEACARLFRIEDYSKYLKLAEGGEHPNPYGWATNALATDLERKCITTAIQQVQETYTTGTIIHDGFLVESLNIDPQVLRDAEDAVERKVGFRIQLVSKPLNDFDPTQLWGDSEDDELEKDADMTDMEACELFVEHLRERGFSFVKSRKRVYFYDPSKGLWDDDKDQLRCFLKDCPTITKKYRGMAINQNNLIKQLGYTNEVAEDNDFLVKAQQTSYQKLPFKNGVWDYKRRCLLPYSPDLIFFKRLPYDHTGAPDPALKKELMDRVIHGVFGVSKGDYYLKVVARAMAGEIYDKAFVVVVGDSNSGKGVNTDLLRLTFGLNNFIGNYNSGAFAVRKNSVLDAKAFSWLVPIKDTRIAFSNEASMETSLDGNIIKMISSGGDTLTARQNHQDEQDFIPQTTIFAFLNDIPQITPKDDAIMNRLSVIETEYSYLSGDDYERNKSLKNVRRADDDLKSVWIKKAEVQQAFAMLVCEAYEDTKPLRPPEVKQDTAEWSEEDGVEEIVKNLFEATGKEEDYVLQTRLINLAKSKTNNSISPNKIGKLLKKLGLERKKRKVNGKAEWCFNGIRLIEGAFADY